MNSSLSKLIPSSSISTKRGVSTYNSSASILVMSMRYADIYPSWSESSNSKILAKFNVFFLFINLLVLFYEKVCSYFFLIFYSFYFCNYYFLSRDCIPWRYKCSYVFSLIDLDLPRTPRGALPVLGLKSYCPVSGSNNSLFKPLEFSI